MAVKTKEEILKEMKSVMSGHNDDDGIAFIEDITDTMTDYEQKSKDSTDWKAKYDENDKMWREKYKARFFNKDAEAESSGRMPDGNTDFIKGSDGEEKKKTKFEDLFTIK